MMLANLAECGRHAAVLARAAHWRRYDLDRLPKDDPVLWVRAAEILRALPGARVGVRPKPTTAAEEAELAERRAQGKQANTATLNR